MVTAIAELTNKAGMGFNNDPFMTFLSLNRSLTYRVRASDKALRYGTVK
jgi:hypothetical protein